MFRSRIMLRWLVAALFAAALFTGPARAVAAGGYKFGLPSGTKNPSGLSLTLENRGVDANGYRPMEITIAPRPATKPLKADRQLRVVLAFQRWGRQSTSQVSQVIELPEGTTGVSTVMLVPEEGGFNSISLATYEGGEKWLDLSEDYIGMSSSNGWSWTEAKPALLVIDSLFPPRAERESMILDFGRGIDPRSHTLPDLRALLSHFPDDANPRGGPPMPAAPVGNPASMDITDAGLLTLIRGRLRTEVAAPAEVPTRWLELSQFDVAVISLEDLTQLAQAQPERFRALRDWVATGPLLIVYGVERDFGKLPALEKTLALSPLPRQEQQPELCGWTVPRSAQDIGRLITPFEEAYDVSTSGGFTGENALEETEAKTIENGKPPFVFRRANLGCVVAMGDGHPFPGRTRDWAYVFNAVPENHWKWFRRAGFSLQRTNDDYWKFLIKGVGKAPVVLFMVLVSLFAVVIGPVNFWLLKRSRRLYLLLLTVPAGAAVVTGALIVFALFSDGFAVRTRLRSFTDLDQRTGQAAMWSRQSYYAAMAPSQGLVFPDDALVLPLAYEPGASSLDRATLLHWDGEQYLRRGYLSARTATQFMVARAARSEARLVVSETAGAGQPPTVENRLGTRILYVLLSASDGRLYSGAGIAENGAKELTATDLRKAVEAMRPIADAAEPANPDPNSDPRMLNDDLFTLLGASRNRYYSMDGSAGDPLMSQSILETSLNACVRGLSKGPPAPSSYIAIVERSPLVVTGLGRARQEASLHVIRGWIE